MKVLIAYDGSECSDIALSDLRNAGLPAQCEAHIVSAADAFVPEVEGKEDIPPALRERIEKARAHTHAEIAKAQAYADQAKARLAEMYPQWTITTSAPADTPAWAVVTKIEEWGANYAVVGSHGYGFFHRARLGSVSEKVVLESKCSVRVAKKPDHETNTPLRIVLGHDGSDDAKAALDSLLHRHFPQGTQVHVISALDLRMVTAIGYLSVFTEELLDITRDDDHAIVQRLVNNAVAQLKAKGFDATGFVDEGDPKKILIKHAEEWQADVIVVGAHGATRTERFLMGSVSSAITSRAHCSVEVVRP
ncbi:MAG TPA: universal stress protein [Candidatus Kapabacteria bacterium]|nr:universal stress protein [Candidatus Kapabacteria bacterium]